MPILKKKLITPDNTGKFTRLDNLSGIRTDIDADLVAANIVVGKNIFGVTGTHFDELSGSTEVSIKFGENITEGDPVYFDLDVLVRDVAFEQDILPNLRAVGKTVYDVCWSGDSQYVMYGCSGVAPYFQILKRNGDTYTVLDDPVDGATGAVHSIGCSDDGVYWGLAHSTSPYVTFYKRSGDTFTKLATPSTPPTGNAYGASMTKDGVYFAVGHYKTPFISIYKRTGDTWAKLSNPGTLPGDHAMDVDFSPDGTYLAYSYDDSSSIVYHKVYKRTGDTFGNATMSPTYIGVNDTPSTQYGAAFSPDGTHLMMGTDIATWCTMFKRSGDKFTRLKYMSLPYDPRKFEWHPDGEKLLLCHQNTTGVNGNVVWYNRSGDTFTSATGQLPGIQVGPGKMVARFAPNGMYLFVGADDPPEIQHWMYDLKAMKSGNLRANIVGTYGAGIALESGVTGETKSVLMLLS